MNGAEKSTGGGDARARLVGALSVYLPVAVVTALLARSALSGILAKAGHPAVPLDDAFIHFQYAKRLAQGHFFSYVDGEGYSSGATSLLWPVLLAPFWALGMRELSIIWAAWGIGFVALGALSVEAYRLAEKLAGRGPAIGAGAMVLAFGGYTWCAASGMEVTLLAWVLARAGRLVAEWGEASGPERTTRRRRELVVLALVAPLVRPEGMIASAMIAAALAIHPATGPGRPLVRRAFALVACVGPLLPPLVNVALTGHAASSTTMVKWLPANPYYASFAALWPTVRENARTFFDVLMDGREWSAVFVPSGSRPFAVAAICAIPLAGYTTGRLWRSLVVLTLALAMLLPCTYLSFLWNRLRYLWPFAFAWFIGLSCVARMAGEVAASIRPRWRVAGTMIAGLFAGGFASHLGWSLDDLATSAAAIDRQQVLLGRWASTALPSSARIGLNDTGAIAYLSGRKTFDVVGLTTPGEARYWVAGAGSRFEHYERLFEAGRDKLPTHFVVYPNWMACDAVLGDELTSATVTDQTILGGPTMTAYETRYDLLLSGAIPDRVPEGVLVDELDVADLESEAEHGYELGPNTDADDIVISLDEDDRMKRVDGARVRRSSDGFVARLRPSVKATVIGRFHSAKGATVAVEVEGRKVGELELAATEWEERAFEIPADLAREKTRIRLSTTGGQRFGSAHYWFYSAR